MTTFQDPATAQSPQKKITAAPLLFNMERSFILGVAILIVLISFTHGSPINEANEADLMNRDSLLEKLGMELHRQEKTLNTLSLE